MRKKFDKLRIVDIARLSGVSVGTIDRLLHNRGGVSQETRAKIEEVLELNQGKVDKLGLILLAKQQFLFAVILPKYNIGENAQKIHEGVLSAIREFKMFWVDAQFFFYDQFDTPSYEKILSDVSQGNFHGIVLMPIFKEESYPFLSIIESKKTPYIFVDSTIADSQPTAVFAIDTFSSGYTLAKLVFTSPSVSEIVIFRTYRTGSSRGNVSRLREEGFIRFMESNNVKAKVHQLELSASDREKNKSLLSNFFKQYPNVHAGVIFNGRIHLVAQEIRDFNLKIKLYGFDLTPENRHAMQFGQISYLIGQRPTLQGYNSIKTLVSMLIFKEPLPPTQSMPIDIIVPETEPFYDNL